MKDFTEVIFDDFTKVIFQAFVVVSIGLLGFMALSIYNMHVIDQQSALIRQLQTSCH